MGVCVKSPKREFRTGYITFNHLRARIAGMLGDEWRTHYNAMLTAPYDMIWSEYDDLTERMAESLPERDLPVLDFLYASDCEGEMDPEHCRALAGLMDRTREEWQDEGRSYAYAAYDPFTLADFYNLVQDGWDTGEGISWD